MVFFRLPKTIKWVWIIGLLLLIMMTLYRLIIYNVFRLEGLHSAELGEALWLGVRYDARIIGFFSLLVLLVSWIPGLHAFKRSRGKLFSKWLYMLLGVVFVLSYSADFISLAAFGQRLEAYTMAEVLRGGDAAKQYWQNAPLLPMLLAIGVGIWLWWILLGVIHHMIGKKQGLDDKGLRLYWQIFTVIVCLFAMYGSLLKKPLGNDEALSLASPVAQKLALNPFQSLFVLMK